MTETNHDYDAPQTDEVVETPAEFVDEPVADVYAPSLTDYWGPVFATLESSRDAAAGDKAGEITVTTADKIDTRGKVAEIEADWVALVHDAGIGSPEMVYWIARAHITRVVARTGN